MNTTVQIFRALGNENRLRILCALAAGARSVNELAELLGRSQPVISQHLARLRSAGLVDYDRRPPSVFYSLISNGAARELYDLVQRLYCGSDKSGGSEGLRPEPTQPVVGRALARRQVSGP